MPHQELIDRRAHCRPSRIAHTTSDWPRRMSPAANTLVRRWSHSRRRLRSLRLARCRAHPSRRRTLRAPATRGCVKPIASSTRSAFISTPCPALPPSCRPSIRRAPRSASRPCRSRLRSAWSRPPSRARSLPRATGRGAQLDRPVRPDQRLVLFFGRLRQQLELRDALRAMAVAECRRSREPVSPPPITMTCLPSAQHLAPRPCRRR